MLGEVPVLSNVTIPSYLKIVDFSLIARENSVALAAADLIHGEAKIGDHQFEGAASLGVLPEVLARGGYRASVFFGQGFVVRFDHDFEKLHDGG